MMPAFTEWICARKRKGPTTEPYHPTYSYHTTPATQAYRPGTLRGGGTKTSFHGPLVLRRPFCVVTRKTPTFMIWSVMESSRS